MSRVRTGVIDDSNPDGSWAVLEWAGDPPEDDYVIESCWVYSGKGFYYDQMTIWGLGLVSFGQVTEGQRAFMANVSLNSDLADFPGDFVAIGFRTAPYDTILVHAGDYVQTDGGSFTSGLDGLGLNGDDSWGIVGWRIGDHSFAPIDQLGEEIPWREMSHIFGTETGETLPGTSFAETIYGLGGDDNIMAGAEADAVYGGAGSDYVDGQEGNDELFGDEDNDVLMGGAGYDVLDGGNGNDVLQGGDGRDTFYGGAGDDDMQGGPDEDTLTFASAASGVTIDLSIASAQETGGSGSDTISGIEDLIGSAFADILKGDAYSNAIQGGLGDDTLDGGENVDTLRGGDGNDTYLVDDTDDSVHESPDEGTDLVISSVSFSLGWGDVENLQLVGSADAYAYGNSLANIIIGNDGNNDIAGYGAYGGADTLEGGLGNDTYYYPTNLDHIIESVGGGIADLVVTDETYTLPKYVENLTLTGWVDVNGSGNASDNVLNGNSLDNILSGGAGDDVLKGGHGADTMKGGSGDDVFFVDNPGDHANEGSATGGIDVVKSSVSFTLGANVENLTLTGTSAIAGKGNALANAVTGNGASNGIRGLDGNDALNGGAGNDTLYGGLGIDKLTGGAGADRFVFDTALSGTNRDNISDFSIADDSIVLDRTIFIAFTATGTLASAAFFTGAAAHDASDRVIYNSATGNIYYDADGSGGGAQVLIAHVAAGLPLTNADFLIVS